jgi:hypothetical protein
MRPNRPNRQLPKLARRLFSLGFFSLFFLIHNAKADFFIHAWENHTTEPSQWQLQVNTTFFGTSSNYDALGNSVNHPNGLTQHSRTQTDLNLHYGIDTKWTVYGRGSWAYVTQSGTLRPSTVYGPADQSLGAHYRLWQNEEPHPQAKTFLDLQLQFDFPAYSNSTPNVQNTATLGDGTTDITFGIFSGLPMWTTGNHILHFVTGLGYTQRSLDFSSAIPWIITIAYSPVHPGFKGQLSWIGLTSLKTDPQSTSTSLRSNAGSGGSYYTGAVNPSLMMIRGNLGYQLSSKTEFFCSLTQTIWGQDTPQSTFFTLGLQLQLGSSSRQNINDPSAHPALMTPAAYGHSNQGFIHYSLSARVLKSNDRLNLVKIDKGSQDGIMQGQLFDLFSVAKEGSLGEPIARGEVTHVRLSEAALDIVEFFKEVWIEEGFIAKRVVQ